MRIDFYIMRSPRRVDDDGIIDLTAAEERLELIRQWDGIDPTVHFIPQQSDWVILHWGDYNERGEVYRVFKRIVDGATPDVVKIVVTRIDTLRPEVAAIYS